MNGPTRDFEDILAMGGKKVYYNTWSCPECMESIIEVEPEWCIS